MNLIIGIAGVIVGIVAIVVSIVVTRHYRERRELSYEVSTTPPLLSVNEELKDSIEVKYEGHLVTDLSGATVTISNTGNRGVPVPRQTEYEYPITLYYVEAEIIGNSRIIRTEPDDLKSSVTLDEGKVLPEPVLLNPGQKISIFALLSNFNGKVEITGQIKDTDIKQVGFAPFSRTVCL